MALDLTSFDAALQEHYTDERVERLTLTDHPLLALLAKYTRFTGDALPIPLVHANPQNRSATYAYATGGTSTSQLVKFVLTRVSEYSLAYVDGETIDASEGNASAFMSAAATEFDGAYESAALAISTALYRNGTGSIGVVATSGISTNSLTLATTADAINFEVGMKIVESATDGGTLGAGGTTGEVISAIDYDTGVLTSTNTNWTDVLTAITDAHYLYCLGDHNAKVSGLDKWIPSTAVGISTLFGVTRSVNPTKLGGCRYDGSSEPIEEALKNGAIKAAKYGGRVSHYFVSFERWSDLENALGSRVVYTMASASAQVGFQAISINGPKGPIKVIPDASCQADTGWGLDMRRWKIYSLGKLIRVLSRSGGKSQRVYNADSEEYRIGGYFQLGCRAPGHNVRVTVQT